MNKRILSLVLTFALLLSMVVPVLAASFDGGSTPSTFSASTAVINKKVKLVPTARLFTAPYSDTYIDYSSIPADIRPAEYTVLKTEWYNNELWYGLSNEGYGGDADYTYLMCVYIRAKDTILTDTKIILTVDGETIEGGITVEGTGKDAFVTITAGSGEYMVQWQIRIPGTNIWANIMPGNSSHLNVNYGLLKNLLSSDSQAQIRCRCTDSTTGVVYYSDSVTVTYNENNDENSNENFVPDISDAYSTDAAGTLSAYTLDIPTVQNNEPVVMQDVPVPTSDGDVEGTQPQGENSDVKQTYNIIINYVFENNEIVSDPYTANLAAGSSFSATVTFPTQQGYLPYVNNEQQNGIELNYESINEDVTINVVYKPTNVNYTVIHYQQNVDNDQYTIESTETSQGLTGSTVPEVAKTFEGFYNLLYERPAIAADGSTVIEVYYDRYYYLLNFDMDGGYGTDPVYARYGAGIGTVENPSKAGYTFEGWSETRGGTTAVILPATMSAESKTYYAIWKTNATAKVTVVFWGENADNEEYSYLSDYTKEINLTPGMEFTYSETGMLICVKETHTHADDCYEFSCTTEAHEHNNDCYTCGNAEHKHDASCYPGASSSTASAGTNAPSNPQNGYVYRKAWSFNDKVIYINGQWYDYSGSVDSGSTVSPTCGMVEHTHTDACIGCGKIEHAHTRKDCYKLTCQKEEHTHISTCYAQGAGLDSTLWKFVKSDTITVAADGSSVVNVYYDRVEYSIQFYNNQSCSTSGWDNKEYTDLKITAKWGENVLSKWPTYNNSSSWLVKDKSNTWQNSIQVMPVGGAKFWGPKTGNSKYTATYYVEILDGESYDVTGSDNRYYKVHHTDTSVSSGNVTDEERYGIDGFTINNSISTKNGTSYGDSKFYYTRNSYKLTFNDQYNDVKNETVKFEASLSTYKDYIPDVPSAYEPGSMEFGGWYQNPQCTGEEYKLDEHTMPSHDIILYAKWVPVTRIVKFYLLESSTDVYKPEKADTSASFEVPHGDNIAEDYVKNHLEKSAMNEAKPNGDYTFVMWYYYEDGEKKPFDPTMQIRKDLTLYGEWSSNTLKQYTVQYVLKSDHSVKISDDLTGSGLAGTTKTFDAKGGAELYVDYQEGYFPTVQSQSLLLDIESNSLVVTFEYVPMPAVPYTVRYVEKDTGNSLAGDKVVSDNRKAVVTETFKPISGYMPDAYQKRLVVTADGENILYFYYTKDEEHAYYKITHYIQNTDGATWTEYASSQAIGDIGTRYTASSMTIPGFAYQEIRYVVNGTEVTDVTAEGAMLTADGLEINLYYVRNEYPYLVRYLEQGSGKVLHDSKKGTGKYGQMISESAIDIDGYDKVDPTSASLNIHIDEGEGAPNLNIITFYYKEKEVIINYVAVGPEGATNFGSVDPTTETVKVKSGTAQGSIPTAGDGFKFVGWFKDADCTRSVDTSWVTDNKIIPRKTDDKNVAATYYAKFEYDVADLKIIKTGANDNLDPDQTFIFTITGPDNYKITVAIKGNDSITIKGLKIGSYTVHEESGWSWRYECSDQSVTLQPGITNEVKMVNTRKNDKYLDGNAYVENKFSNKAKVKKEDDDYVS